MSMNTFDPSQYKRTTEQQWQHAAEAWNRWAPTLSEWLGPATELMLTMARVGPGSRVLDVAAGAGQQSIAAARRVGPSGYVLATDISDNILRFAAAEAAALDLGHVECRRMDGELIDVEPGSFDAVISRVGLIYFPDRHAALVGMRRALRPGGRAAAIVYSTPENNPFFSTPAGIIRRHAKLGPPIAGQPGPFCLGSPGVLDSAFERAGFRSVETARIAAPVRMKSSAECVRFERESFGALHQMLDGLDQDSKDAAWAEIARELAIYEGPDGFEGPCELLVTVGVN